MALQKSKQLNPKPTGSFSLSGSFVGDSVSTGSFAQIEFSSKVSGSVTTTGSFGTVETAGDINSEGRIYEKGSSVIDHATAMAIVFGG